MHFYRLQKKNFLVKVWVSFLIIIDSQKNGNGNGNGLTCFNNQKAELMMAAATLLATIS